MQDCWNFAATAAGAPIADRGDAGEDQSHGRNDQWHDPVTGLARPQCFLKNLERLLAMPRRPLGSIAMLVLEVADFPMLRAQLGKARCDELLRAIGERLHDEVPEPNLVTRLRGAEFAVVLHDLGPEVTPEALATDLLERASRPCSGGDRLLRWALVGALALPGERSETALQLFHRATRALARGRLRSAAQGRWRLSLG